MIWLRIVWSVFVFVLVIHFVPSPWSWVWGSCIVAAWLFYIARALFVLRAHAARR